MIAREALGQILRSAAQAPSGDNAQPWRFEVHEEIVDLYNIPGQDYSPYNFRERGSFFANGAAIENLVIAASTFGYAVEESLFPEPADGNHVAQLTFMKKEVTADPLAKVIESRITNRKPYEKKAFMPDHHDRLAAVVQEAHGETLIFLTASEDIQHFAKTVTLSDRLIFEEKSVHDAIFHSIRWSREEEDKKPGMYVKTLELPPPAEAMFRLLRSWPTLSLLNHIGISKFIASQSAAVYASSSAIGMMTALQNRNEDYVRAGRSFERLWLTATQLGMSIQPVTALAYLAERVAAGDAGELSSAHAQAVTEAQQAINKLFGNPSGTVVMMFRIGYGAPPSAHSHKLEPNINFRE